MTDQRRLDFTDPLRWFTVENPALARDVDRIRDRQIGELVPAFQGRELDWRAYDKLDLANTNQVKDAGYQLALGLHEKLLKQGDAIRERARTRYAMARYLHDTVAPWALQSGRHYAAAEYRTLAGKLEDARPWGTWGVYMTDGSLVTDWVQRAGLVKLCPDDARAEGRRAAARYVPWIEALTEEGFECQYAVFTIPNVPRWHLAAGIDAIYSRFKKEILYARVDGKLARSIDDPKRKFPELRGALATLEAPLSGRGDWNVHLNVLMVFDRRPDWRVYREAWGAQVEFQQVPAGAAEHALRELVKYPLKAITLKSTEVKRLVNPKRDREGRLLTPAPPVIEWPAEAFDEWWRAHKGLRRTRSWGVLYAQKVPEPVGRNPELVDWIGKVTVTPARFTASPPMPDTRHLDARQMGRVDLILGNKSAAKIEERGTGPPVQSVN